MVKGNVWPTEFTPLDWSPKKIVASDYFGNPYGCAKFVANPSTGDFSANEWNIAIFFIYIYFFSWTQTRLRIFTLDGSYDADSRTDVPFGDFVDIAVLFGGEIPTKPQFLGVNRRFQAKPTKYWQFQVIETTASILTKFDTTIQTTKTSLPVVQQIQDGGWPPFWKKTVK